MTLETIPQTQSTLLIPNRLLRDFDSKTKILGKDDYLNLLIRKYKFLILMGQFSKKSKVKTVYQSDGENLVRRNFRPKNEDWLEFGLLADFLGVSKCALFVMLLSLEVGDGDLLLSQILFGNEVPPATDSIFLWKGLSKPRRKQYVYKIRNRNRQRGEPKK